MAVNGEVNGDSGWILANGEGAYTVRPSDVGAWPWETVNGVPWYRRWLFFRVIDWDYLAGLRRAVAKAWAWVKDPAGEARRAAGWSAGNVVVGLAVGFGVVWLLLRVFAPARPNRS